jgi:hypothetical protein
MTTTAIELLNSLNPDRIRERLAELDREAIALRTLLRAALARRRRQPTGRPGHEVGAPVGAV